MLVIGKVILTYSCFCKNQAPGAVSGLLAGKGEKSDQEEDQALESTEVDETKLPQQETLFLTGVLDELKIVISNSLDVSRLP